MLTRLDRGGCILTVIVLMLVSPRIVEGKVVLTNFPSRRIEAFTGETVRFNWNYTVGDKNMDFGYYVSSPVWYYYNTDGTKSVIAVDDGLHGWKWTLSRRTCPTRLLYPTVRISKESVATLVISNVTKNDNGWYGISLVLRISPSITNKVELIVTDKMARFTKMPSSTLFVAKGKAARFEWNYTYDNQNIEFYPPESPMWAYVDQNNQWVTIATVKKDPSSSAVINTTTCPARLLNPTRVRIEQPATLIISNVTEADNGIYGCMLRLKRELSINSTSTLVVTDHPKVFLSALATKIIQEGSSFNISCSANASPVPHVTWMKISPQKRLAVSETVGLSFLKFMEIKRNQGGTYECQATNNPFEPPVTSKINIFVIYFEHSSTLLDKNGEAQIVEGEDLNITCAISPLWLDNVTWVHVPTHEFLKLGSVKVNSGTLAIRNFSRSQQGKYQCQAYDKKDGILGIANVFIKVMYKPEIDEILSSKHNVSWSRDTIYLRCVARGVPVPNVTWYGLNGKIRVNGTSYYPGTSTLRLLKLYTLDFGIYSCLAKNRYGIAWHNVTVTKYCPCKLTEQKKKKREKKNNNPAIFFGSTASIVLLPLSAVSFLINVFLLLILCKSKRFPQTKRPNKTSNAVEFFYNNDSTDAGQIIFGNINSEPPTAVQSESMTNTDEAAQGHYAELTSNSVKMSSLQNYEHLDPTCREQHHPKGFQTFGNHEQSNYEQLHSGTSLPVYQRLDLKCEDIKN